MGWWERDGEGEKERMDVMNEVYFDPFFFLFRTRVF